MSEPKYIGIAEMDERGVLDLRLSAASPYGFGGSHFTYFPDDPEYDEVVRHLGGIRPGETKSVPPWPDGSSAGGAS